MSLDPVPMVRPRVAVTGLRGLPATWGGVERQCEELYSRLAAKGFDITIYARAGYVPKDVTAYRGMRVKVLPTLSGKHSEALAHTFLALLHIGASRYDIVHIYSQGPFLLSPITRLLNPRAALFFTCGGLDWQRKKWSFAAQAAIRLGEWFSARLASRVVVVSKALAEYYRQRYGVEAACIVNGVDIPAPTPMKSAPDLGLKPGGYFLFVGRLVAEKRIQDLMEALRLIDTPLKLVIAGGSAGDAPYEAKLRGLAQADSRIVMAGYCFEEKLAALYSNALAYVTASELEGLPLSLLEAMSHALPCLASDIAPHKEVLEGIPGSLFHTSDPQALARSLQEIMAMSPQARRELGARCLDRVRHDYSWDQAADQLGELYLQAAGDKR